jgi:hypothetical protein
MPARAGGRVDPWGVEPADWPGIRRPTPPAAGPPTREPLESAACRSAVQRMRLFDPPWGSPPASSGRHGSRRLHSGPTGPGSSDRVTTPPTPPPAPRPAGAGQRHG